MKDTVDLAVIGLGRIGAIHARHVRELPEETGSCQLAALVDCDGHRAEALAEELNAPRIPPPPPLS